MFDNDIIIIIIIIKIIIIIIRRRIRRRRRRRRRRRKEILMTAIAVDIEQADCTGYLTIFSCEFLRFWFSDY